MSTKDAPLAVNPEIRGPAARILVVRAPYYEAVVEGMSLGASSILDVAGCSYDILDVAGAFELPQAIRIVLRGREKYDGFVALGCVIRGETDHYTFICAATLQGFMDVALQYGIALGSGLLTVDTIEQATARSGADGHNKGGEAAIACLRQIDAIRRFGAA